MGWWRRPGLDPAILAALHDGFRRALHDPAHLAVLARLDQPVEYLNSADYARNMAETIDLEEKRVYPARPARRLKRIAAGRHRPKA